MVLISIIMKCFEHILAEWLYRECHLLSLFLSHNKKLDSYVRRLFISFSSAFNTIIPRKLIVKLSKQGLNTTLLTERPHTVQIGCKTSSRLALHGYIISSYL